MADRTEEQSNEPSTSGTSTAPSEPTTTSIDLTATIHNAVPEGLIAASEGLIAASEALKAASEALKAAAEALKVMDIDANNNAGQTASATPITLGNLFQQDMKTANIMPNFPTSFVQNYRFLNDERYHIYDIQKSGCSNNPFQYLQLQAGRICSIAGNEFSILMDKQPSDGLMAHWKKWLPQFPEPKFKTVDEGIEDEDSIVTIFPMQRIPKEKHAVDPDTHYHVLLKSAIPKTGAPCPKHFTPEDAVFSCMVKMDQSLGGRGNYVAKNPEELAKSLELINDNGRQEVPYVITEFVQNVEETLGCQFYLNKRGEVHWLGTNVNLLK